MSNQHAIKSIFLIHNLRWGFGQRGKASRTSIIYLNKIINKQIKRSNLISVRTHSK